MRRLLIVVLSAVILAACTETPTEPGSREFTPPTVPERECTGAAEEVDGVGCVVNKPGAIEAVKLSTGREILIHGVDPPDRRPPTPLRVGAARPPLCADTNRLVFLYASIVGRAPAYAESLPVIRTQIADMNGLLNSEAQETGGVSADFKVRCADDGAVFVGAFVAPAGDFSSVVEAAIAAGYNVKGEKYQIFADDSSQPYCGLGEIYKDSTKSPTSLNNHGPMYAMTERDCWVGRTAMHEAGHTLGAVQLDAPDSSGGYHCDGSAEDVMCYNDGGGTWDADHACVETEPGQHFDYCHNDYFHAGTPEGYLATHFNLATDSVFIQLGSPPPPPPPPPPTMVTESFTGSHTKLDIGANHAFASGVGMMTSSASCTRSKATKHLPYLRHELLSGDTVLASVNIACTGAVVDLTAPASVAGTYFVRLTKVAGAPQSITRYRVDVNHPVP